MEIIPYRREYKEDFINLSLQWLEKDSLLEPEDIVMLDNVEAMIAEGAMLFFAVEEHTLLAACMIHPLSGGVWELCKLGVPEEHRGKGAGRAVFHACMEYAKNSGAEKVVLVSNHVLTTAIAMYERYGFTYVPLDPAYAIYKTADVQMEYCFTEGEHHADRTL